MLFCSLLYKQYIFPEINWRYTCFPLKELPKRGLVGEVEGGSDFLYGKFGVG